MTLHNQPEQTNRALVPLPPRTVSKLGLLLPAPATQRLMIAATAGAIGGIFVKRLIELVTDDVYRRLKSLAPGTAKAPLMSAPQQGTGHVRVTRIQAWSEQTPWGHRRRIRLRQCALPDETAGSE